MDAKLSKKRRSFWLKELHRWHWISSAICLVGTLLFALTGITLNHAGAIESRPAVTTRTAEAPPDVQAALRAGPKAGRSALPPAAASWLDRTLGVATAGREAEWQAGEVYVALPRPGGDAWLTVDRQDGAVLYERTERGWVSYLNDLHKGRNTGLGWTVFIDVFAVACLVFCLTGLWLLQLHSHNRPSTWPLVGFGLAVPVVLLVLFVH